MFTGLIEEIGEVKSLSRIAVGKLVVKSSKIAGEVGIGDSVSINGVCLTVTSTGNGEMSFDAVPETISRSNLADLDPGDKVNLETSLKAGKPICGHFVQGHVDAVGAVESIRSVGDSWMIFVAAPEQVMRYVVEKGSIAVDGISLTVASCDDKGFAVAVIPHTLSATNLHTRKPGDKVNLEADIIGKYVEKFVGERGKKGVTEDMLKDAGFV